jgi:hypothetical protein
MQQLPVRGRDGQSAIGIAPETAFTLYGRWTQAGGRICAWAQNMLRAGLFSRISKPKPGSFKQSRVYLLTCLAHNRLGQIFA